MPKSIMYYSRSIAAINSRLDEDSERTSEGLIISVLGFACYDVSLSFPRPANLQMRTESCPRLLLGIGGSVRFTWAALLV